jgi:purine-binding chemotaxis protein CheW
MSSDTLVQEVQEVQETTAALNKALAAAVHEGGKFLTFFLDSEEYALEILTVHEIIGVMAITPVPRTPEFILGVLNLRGRVIPVIDLRSKFGMETVEWTEETCIIVVQIQGSQRGIVVDKVSEVLDIPAADIDETPSFGSNVNTDYIMGIGKSETNVKLLLDIEKALTNEDLSELTAAAKFSDNQN